MKNEGTLDVVHGRKADGPQQIPAAGWKDILLRTYKEINEDRVTLIAAAVTYYLLLALFPTLSAFVSIYGFFIDPSEVAEQVNLLASVVPEVERGRLKHVSCPELFSPGTLLPTTYRPASNPQHMALFSQHPGGVDEMVNYRVIDLRSGAEAEAQVDARSPILAATLILGENVVKGNRNLGVPVCRVYWQDSSGSTNMVRLYRARLGLGQAGWP